MKEFSSFADIQEFLDRTKLDNETLRRLLWISHGCPFPALYGDDGEMQCHQCCLDFKRDSVQRIDERFTTKGMERYMKEMAKKKNETNSQ